MEHWEYLSTFLVANAKTKESKQYIKDTFNKKPKAFSPESMIPDLNKLGAEGWELVHMEPVPNLGRNDDVQFDPYRWSSTYFCVFKRRKAGSSMPVHVRPVENPTS
jgi:hypothetical protein